MPSTAALNAQKLIQASTELAETASDPRLRPIRRARVQIYYHAALVAAWDSYIKALVREFFQILINVRDQKFSEMHEIAFSMTERLLKKFNTPNWENTRNVLILTTGYDPQTDWQWPARRMNGQQVHLFLNEVLRVRHSFAHGFSIPGYSWTQSATGRIRLTKRSLADVTALFKHLIKVTDKGMKEHIRAKYQIRMNW